MASDRKTREARRFEPPPWERDRFEELERQKQEPAREPESERDAQAAQITAPEQGSATGAARQGSVLAGEGPDERILREMDVMLVALKAEEPEVLSGAWRFTLAAAVMVVTTGLILVVWGSVAMARAGGTGAGVMGAAIMTVMGALFAALGVWMGVRSLRQRGVL